MSDKTEPRGEHTPLPWKLNNVAHRHWITGQEVWQVVAEPEITANAAFIIEACNSYYSNQETIRELVEALNTLVKCASDLTEDADSDDWEEVVHQFECAKERAENTLSRAKESQT